MTPGLYVYGVVETGSLSGAVTTPGITGDLPSLVDVDGLTAVVCGVDVAEFEGEALERNVASPEWLEQKVRAHEAVLEDVLERAAVVPMRFGAIFSSPEGLRRMMTEHAEALRAALARVRGRTEWGVKLHCDASRLAGSIAGGSSEAGSGRGYLMQRKAQLDAGARAAEAAAEVAAQTHQALAELADEAVLSVGRTNEVLNGAYLVRDDGRGAFMRRVEELQRAHEDAFAFEVTGPWPPYNFTSADVGGPRS
jgi:hypothetical protein